MRKVGFHPVKSAPTVRGTSHVNKSQVWTFHFSAEDFLQVRAARNRIESIRCRGRKPTRCIQLLSLFHGRQRIQYQPGVAKLLACGQDAFDQQPPQSMTPPGGADIQTFNLANARSEEHTSELQSQSNLVCRLLLEKKK